MGTFTDATDSPVSLSASPSRRRDRDTRGVCVRHHRCVCVLCQGLDNQEEHFVRGLCVSVCVCVCLCVHTIVCMSYGFARGWSLCEFVQLVTSQLSLLF